MIAGVTFHGFYFRLFEGTIKSPQVVAFLKALRQQIRRKLLVIWDGLAAHKSRLVRDFVARLDGAIQLERLPAYAPEINPVEYLWAHLKQHEVGNFCAIQLAQVSDFARRRLKSMQRRPTLVTAFWQQAELAL